MYFFHSASCGRIENAIQNLPSPYVLNKPKLLAVSHSERRTTITPPPYALNWIANMNKIEVLVSFNGKKKDGQISRLSKQTFFQRYVKLIKTLPCIRRKTIVGDYAETKLTAKDYQVSR